MAVAAMAVPRQTTAKQQLRPTVKGLANGPQTNGVRRANPTKAAAPAAPSAYGIMANRIANRVAEMAEGFTIVERQKPQEMVLERKRPRKLEMRLPTGPAQDKVSFSPAFLDGTLQMMLQLQTGMLKTTASLSKMENVDDALIKEQAGQSAELSRIIAMICAEKAREGA